MRYYYIYTFNEIANSSQDFIDLTNIFLLTGISCLRIENISCNMNTSSDNSDFFKTPSPSRRRKGQRNLFTDRCTRNRSVQQNEFRSDMERLPRTPNFSSPRSLLKDRSRTDPLPKKFRREMPMSARKIEPMPIPPSERQYLPILQSSFYGTKKSPEVSYSSDLESTPTYSNQSSKQNRPALHSIQSSNSIDLTKKQGLKGK